MYGGEDMVMALWRTGVAGYRTWAPPADRDLDGATGHVARHSAQCCRYTERDLLEARARCGDGLTTQRNQLRRERMNARRDFFWGVDDDS